KCRKRVRRGSFVPPPSERELSRDTSNRRSFSFVRLFLDALASHLVTCLLLRLPFGSWRFARASREFCHSAASPSSYPALPALSNEREWHLPIRYYGQRRVPVHA